MTSKFANSTCHDDEEFDSEPLIAGIVEHSSCLSSIVRRSRWDRCKILARLSHRLYMGLTCSVTVVCRNFGIAQLSKVAFDLSTGLVGYMTCQRRRSLGASLDPLE